MQHEENRGTPDKANGTLEVTTNMNCNISLDGNPAGVTQNATFTFENIPFGRHLLEGSTQRYLGSKEIFLNIPVLKVRLTLAERGGTLQVESDLAEYKIRLEGKDYDPPVTLENMKRGVYIITVSGNGFRFQDKIRILNHQTTRYKITEDLVKEKEIDAAKENYHHALELPETTLAERKRKISVLDKILVKETRFDLSEGIAVHRRLVQTIRQEEFAKDTMKKAIQIEKTKKKRRYGWILSIAAALIVLAIGTTIVVTRAKRNRQDEAAYRNAASSGSVSAYRDYLKTFGKNANHYSEAVALVKTAERDKRTFQLAISANTINAYKSYLREFGKTARFRKEAEHNLRKLEIKRDFPKKLKELNLVVIPRGSYFMGASPAESATPGDNQPPVWVRINPFAISRHEVTFDEYDAYCRETGQPLPNDSRFGRGKRPVINVSWNDAISYCAWLSQKTGLMVRLPSEAEWEFACRGGRMSIFFWGNEMDHRYCISGMKKRGRTRPVETTKANDFGLYDMSGNVYEWCADRYQDPLSPGKGERYRGSSYRFFRKYTENESKNPVFNAWGNRRVIRGGSYKSSDFSCRSSHRSGAMPNIKRNDIGFRIAVTIPQ